MAEPPVISNGDIASFKSLAAINEETERDAGKPTSKSAKLKCLKLQIQRHAFGMGHKMTFPANYHFTCSNSDFENGAAGIPENAAYPTAIPKGMIEIIRP